MDALRPRCLFSTTVIYPNIPNNTKLINRPSKTRKLTQEKQLQASLVVDINREGIN